MQKKKTTVRSAYIVLLAVEAAVIGLPLYGLSKLLSREQKGAQNITTGYNPAGRYCLQFNVGTIFTGFVGAVQCYDTATQRDNAIAALGPGVVHALPDKPASPVLPVTTILPGDPRIKAGPFATSTQALDWMTRNPSLTIRQPYQGPDGLFYVIGLAGGDTSVPKPVDSPGIGPVQIPPTVIPSPPKIIFDSKWSPQFYNGGQVTVDDQGVLHAVLIYPNPAQRYGPYGAAMLQRGLGYPGTGEDLTSFNNFSVQTRVLEAIAAGQYNDANAWIGIYYHMKAPQQAFGVTGSILNTQMSSFRQTDSSGGASNYEVGSGGIIKFKPPITSWTGSVDIKAYFIDRCKAIGLDPAVGFDSYGIELGVEGYRLNSFKVDFSSPVLT